MVITTEKLGLGEDNLPPKPVTPDDLKKEQEEIEKLKNEQFPADRFDPEHFPGLHNPVRTEEP